MRNLFAAILIAVPMFANATAWIDPGLEPFAKRLNSSARMPVIAMLDVPDARIQTPYRYDHTGVIIYLRQLAGAALARLPQALQTGTDPDARILEVYWINLSFLVELTPKGLAELAHTPGVSKLYAVRNVSYPQVWRQAALPGDVPYNVKETSLDKLIRERADVDGRGQRIGHIDTGVDGNHPALKGRVALFFDGQKIAPPSDSDIHGTHTAGTLLGGDRQTNLIGMAPAAKLISAGFLRGYDEVLRGMQWILDPDGDPKTKDAPGVVSNSWNVEGAPDVELFYRAISSWEAAGIVPVFSAGNAGPRPQSITKPHEHPAVLAVAATGPDGKVARFSSRGPAVFKGQPSFKPDLSAPGVDIVSSVPGGGYNKLSGTSMACPHVAGAVALVLQVNPALNPAQVRDLMRATTDSVDENGNPLEPRKWNPNYGLGKLNIYQAVKTAIRMGRGITMPDFFNRTFALVREPVKPSAPKFEMELNEEDL